MDKEDDGARGGRAAREEDELERLEVDLLMQGVYRHYGVDFRDYAYASLRRRVWNAVQAEKLATISALQDRVLHDSAAMQRLLLQISVNVTSMFRDPAFYRCLREDVVPLLRGYPFVRIWHAGCSTGEEVYSLSILLAEEDLYSRCRLYATDMDESVLARAKEGIFSASAMTEYADNYRAAGGRAQLGDYYTEGYERAIFKHSLRKNIVFSHHNLATDGSFNEFHLILCRNVMIYFNPRLQARVHGLIYESLRRFGILGLGQRETLTGTSHASSYEPFDAALRLYRKVR